MGSLFRRTVRRPLPKSAVLVEKNGRTLARWKTRGKAYTAPVTVAADGTRTVTVETGTYTARYRTNAGRTVERSTGCRDETNARQKLAKWEKEAEQIFAGVLDAADLDTARAAAGPIGPHLDAYTQALVAAGVCSRVRDGVKILGIGELKAKLTFDVAGASKTARAAIERAGGTVKVPGEDVAPA